MPRTVGARVFGHDPSQALRTDSPTAQNPLLHRGFEARCARTSTSGAHRPGAAFYDSVALVPPDVHSVLMRTWLAVVTGAVMLVALGLLAATSALTPDQGTATVAADPKVTADDDHDADDEVDEADKTDKTDKQSHGSPAWAQAHGMKRLVREHREGMAAFARCRARGGEDCKRPLPPGLAKKR